MHLLLWVPMPVLLHLGMLRRWLGVWQPLIDTFQDVPFVVLEHRLKRVHKAAQLGNHDGLRGLYQSGGLLHRAAEHGHRSAPVLGLHDMVRDDFDGVTQFEDLELHQAGEHLGVAHERLPPTIQRPVVLAEKMVEREFTDVYIHNLFHSLGEGRDDIKEHLRRDSILFVHHLRKRLGQRLVPLTHVPARWVPENGNPPVDLHQHSVSGC
mmetsp:Transcript_25403/g.48138  ORF Transcript_25403/g.48138 Transcript_25403/m.48138 type:complete len:209 (-) Transcript_25403:393-1019(-)